MKGLIFMASRRALPVLRILSPVLLRLLQVGGKEERHKAPRLVFPRLGPMGAALSASTLIKERFFKTAKRFTQTNKELEKQFSFFKSRVRHHGLKKIHGYEGKESCRLGEHTGGQYVSKSLSFIERSALAAQPIKERVKYFASFVKESNFRSKAFQSLLRDALFEKKESRSHVNASFLKENMRESFRHPKEGAQNPPSILGGRAVHVGTVYIEGAQIRDFESFKRELSLAVEDL